MGAKYSGCRRVAVARLRRAASTLVIAVKIGVQAGRPTRGSVRSRRQGSRDACTQAAHTLTGQVKSGWSTEGLPRFVAWSQTRVTQCCMLIRMSVLCYVGRHKPSIHSVSRGKHGGYVALCDSCGVPLERIDNRPWRAAEPNIGNSQPSRHRQAAGAEIVET